MASKYNINIPKTTAALLPIDMRTTDHIAWLKALNNGMVYTNNNMNEYLYGVTYSYYRATQSYSIGNRVIGGYNYGLNTYECISTTYSLGGVVSTYYSDAKAFGKQYSVGDIITIGNAADSAIGVVKSLKSTSGATIDVLFLGSGNSIGVSVLNSTGNNYAVGDQFYVNGGSPLAIGQVTSITLGGNIASYILINTGGSYSTGVKTTTILPAFSGKVDLVDVLKCGWGYTDSSDVSTQTIYGTGSGLKLNITTGGFPPPSYTNNWQMINLDFNSFEEKELYMNQKLTFEWALNKYFNTTFRQPNGVTSSSQRSDIYINDIEYQWSTFHMSATSSASSYMYPSLSSDWMSPGGYTMLSLGVGVLTLYTIYVPKNVLYTLPKYELAIEKIADKYNYTSIQYNVRPY